MEKCEAHTSVVLNEDDDCSQCEFEHTLGEALEHFGLEKYNTERYNKFIVDLYNNGIENVQDYRGRFFYHGPSVVVSDVQDIIQATSCKVQWDSMGYDYVVYPR